MSSTTIVPRPAELGQWNGDPASLAEGAAGRLLLCLETPWFLPMEMQTSMSISRPSCVGPWDVGSYFPYVRCGAMDNGNGDDGDAILLPGTLHQLLVTTIVGILASAMDNGEGSLPPASSCRSRLQCLCLLPRMDEGNGQWN